MAAFNLMILAVVCVCAHAFPEIPVRNTIFGDEKLEGGIFEHEYVPVSTAARNTALDYRLPKTTRPIHYKVIWSIDIGRLSFAGTVTIDLVATQAGVNEIVIHADDLDIASVLLQLGDNTVPQTYTLQKELQFMRITLASGTLNYNAATPVVYTLTINFGAELRNDMYGIYRNWFRNDPNSVEVSWMASTQFQATAARYAFPCYDEPSFKATFDITIRRPTGFHSWSCTLQNDTISSAVTGYVDDIYHTTPVMSTYLLALIVAEYETMKEPENGTLRYEVIARPAALERNQGDYAFHVGQELLAAMSEHTDFDFFDQHPYLKMTQAAIPDFSAGAMENWGLLTYREAYIMYDPENTNDNFKQIIAYILSHEIAHMWFGNMVTNEWWDVLWLNEGFARYYQYFLTHWVEDYMGLDTRFITEQVHTSLLSDSANNPQPLTNPGVGSPAEVSNMFSTISYNKGATIIRMTEHLLGSNVHRQGLRNYLVNRAYDVALPIHLFQELQDVAVATGAIAQYGADFSVIDYYKTWTEQPGHPVLNVQVNHQTGQMTITQRRFNINSGYSLINTNWIIPITFSTASNPDFDDTKPSHILTNTVTVINRGSVGDEWVIFNRQQTGYYRVNYDDYTWNLIVIALRGANRTQIHEYNRAQIVDDVFQFARSGIMSYTRAFNILSFLENETDYAPWAAAMNGYSWLRNRFAGTPLLTRLEAQITRWASRVMSELTYYPVENETFMRSYLRWLLAPVMCNMNVRECREAANAQFRALRDTTVSVPVPVNSRNWVYCNALREGTVDDFDFLFERFRLHQVYTEKILILTTLGCTPHAEALNRYLDAIFGDNFLIRSQDYTSALNSASAGNEANTRIVFEYFKNNLVNVTEADFRNPATPFAYVSSRLRTIAEVEEFEAWATENREALGDIYQTVFDGAESSRQSIRWAAQVQDDLVNYFDNGDEVLMPSTAAPPAPEGSTVSQPDIDEPVTPILPDSAVTTMLSLSVLLAAFAANFIV